MWTCNLGIRNETITQYEEQSLWALHGREQWFFLLSNIWIYPYFISDVKFYPGAIVESCHFNC